MTDELQQRIEEMLDRRGLSWAELGRRIGASDQMLYNWRDRGNVPGKWRRPIASVLGVSLDWLETGEAPNIETGPDVRPKVPEISWVQAGAMGEATDLLYPGEGFDWHPTIYTPHEHTFALRVQGDSMEPTIHAGQIIVCEPDMDAQAGDCVIVRTNDDEATVKRLINDGGTWLLKPDNQRYPVRDMTDDMTVVAVVRYAMSLFR